jgi:hypothetical protein
VKVHQEVAHRDVLQLLRAGIDDDLDPEDQPADQPEPEPEPEPPLSFDVAEANREFRAIAAEQVARLEARLAGHEADERADRADLPSRCSFDATAEGERVHRYQMHWGRALLQTLTAIAKLPDAPGVAEAAAPAPPAESPRPAPAEAAPPEAAKAPATSKAPRRNEPTAEEAIVGQETACVETPGENEATSAAVAAVDGQSHLARREDTGGRHAQRDLREGTGDGRPGPGDAGGGRTVAFRRRRE